MFIVTIGATTSRYTSIIREMNIFFNRNILVVAQGSIVVQAFPISGGNLPEDTIDEVRRIEGVRNIVPMLVFFGYTLEDVIQLVPTNISIGIPPERRSILVGSTPLKPDGMWPSANSSAKEVIAGPSLADQYNLVVGSTIKIKNYNLTIVGILDTPSAILARAIIMPLRVAQYVYSPTHPSWINMMVVEPEEEGIEKEVAENIEANITGLKALTADERNEIIAPLLSDIETWNLGISGMLFFLSMILVTTVAMMNISERIKDFATLGAIGAPRNSIFRIVITETTLIGLFGGLVGILVGTVGTLFLASLYTNIPLTLYFQDLFGVVSPIFMVEILASTLVVSCVAGIIPAINATRANISELLRAEY
jgi:putative ABC transport system permease protein